MAGRQRGSACRCGIELVTVEARVVVASIATYLGYADALSDLRQAGAAHPGYPASTVGKSFPSWSAAASV